MKPFFTNLDWDADGPKPGFVRWDEVLPLRQPLAQRDTEKAVRQKLGIAPEDHAAVGAALASLVAAGTLKCDGAGVNRRYTLVRQWGPSGAPVDVPLEQPARDTALERVQERARQADELRIERAVDRRLRDHGLIR